MQLIFLFETNSKSESDYKYVRSYLQTIKVERKYKYSPIYLNGKGNYNKQERNINAKIKKYDGISKVILFVDVDSTSLHYDQIKLNNEIINYCNLKKYEIVWFKRTIEEVFLNKKIEHSQKTKMADDFLRKDEIKKVNYSKLSISKYENLKNGESNMKYVLDRILKN